MRVIKDCFDPCYGMLKKNQWLPNDSYGHRMLKRGLVKKDGPAKKAPNESYSTKVINPKPKGGKRGKVQQRQELDNQPSATGDGTADDLGTA